MRPHRRTGPLGATPALALSLALAVASAAPGLARAEAGGKECSEGMCTWFERTGSGWRFLVENTNPVLVRASADFPVRDNLAPSEPLPIEARIPAGETVEVALLTRIDPGGRTRVASRVGYRFGDPETRPDPDVRYALPFGGDAPRPVGQVSGITHTGVQRHAVDFDMPVGTPVLAARDGVVLKVIDGFREGGLDPRLVRRSNTVMVAHDDGTIAQYTHLSPGIPVREGARVRVGERLGVSGFTGYGKGPHLHFHVGTVLEEAPGFTIPIRFEDGSAEGFVPELGRRYGPAAERGAGVAAPAPAGSARP